MTITLNNQVIEIESNLMLNTLVFQQVGEKQNGIAVAVNQTVIPKSNWETTVVNNQDEVLIIKATQGG